MYKENFHSHTTYCDGKSTVKEMIDGAVAKGFTALGFSGHSYLDFSCDWCMTPETTKEYIEEIKKYREEYKDKIDIYYGVEKDCFSDKVDNSDFEYTLGSVHYIKEGNEYLAVDESAKVQLEAAKKYYNGDMLTYCERYYETEADVLEMTGSDFIGHFDLVTKFNENKELFDTSDERYIAAWKKAVDKLIPYGKPFEINTGAIARGVRVTPYPALDICDYIHEKGGCFIVTSDCHNADYLDCEFESTYEKYSKYKILSFAEIMKNK